MDDRQAQIKSGAGLDESRINQEFLDFLSKWSTPVLWLLVLIGGAWWGMRYLKERRIERQNLAYASLTEALSGGSPSPATLRTIATEFEGVGSVPELALLRTSDIYLRAAIAGVQPGAEIDPATGAPVSEEDALDEAGARSFMSQAAELSRQVIELAGDDAGKRMIAMQAYMRLGAAQEGLGSESEAKASYTSAASMAREAGFPAIAHLAESRAETVGTVEVGMVLPSNDDLLPLPGEEAPDPEPATGEPTTGELTLPEIIDDATDAVEDAIDDAADAIEDGAGSVIPATEPAADPESPTDPAG